MRNPAQWLALALIFKLLAGSAAAQEREPALGLILAAENATIQRENMPEIGAIGGELLFPGDTIRTQQGSATFILCPGENPATRQTLSTNGEALIERKRALAKSGELTKAEELPVCELPDVEPEPPIGSKGDIDLSARVSDTAGYQERIAKLPEDVQRRLQLLDSALAKNPKDMAAMTSRAALLAKHGMAADAADQYAAVGEVWKGQQWAKVLVHSNRQAAAPARAGRGTTYAVVIGISAYSTEGIPDLRFGHRDAIQFAAYLASARGGEVPANQVKLLYDANATLPGIKESIRFLLQKAGRNDTVVFFISGHGAVSEGEGYLVPHRADVSNLKDSAYPMNELLALMYELSPKVRRFVMFVDACRAGLIGQIAEKNTINVRLATLLKASQDNMIGLLASRQTELAWEHESLGEGHSAFTYFLLRALAADKQTEADRNKDGKVSLSELVRYLENNVPDATQDKQHPDSKLVKIQDMSVEMLVEVPARGIPLADWKPMPGAVFSRKGKGLSSPVARDAAKASSSPTTEPELQQLIHLQEQAQEIMLRYLKGDEIPQVRDDFELGRQLYEQALAIEPGSIFLQSRKEFFHGRRLIFDKEYKQAIEHLESAIRLDPRSPSAYNALGIAYLELGQYREAVSSFESAISRAWYWPYPRHNLALAQMQLGNYDPAILAYRNAMRLAPEYSYLPYNLGLVFQKTNRGREAEDAYLDAIRIADMRAAQPSGPALAESYAERAATPRIALGLLKASQDRDSAAEQHYREALRLLSPYSGNKNVLIATHNLALLLTKKKERWREAENLFRYNINQCYVPSYQGLAEWLAERGESQEAAKIYEVLLTEMPAYTAARLTLAEQLEKSGDTTGQRKHLLLAQQFDRENPTVLIELARFEAGQKNWDAARRAYESALKLTSDPTVRKQIASAVRRMR